MLRRIICLVLALVILMPVMGNGVFAAEGTAAGAQTRQVTQPERQASRYGGWLGVGVTLAALGSIAGVFALPQCSEEREARRKTRHLCQSD